MSPRCEIQAAGTTELYFYGELSDTRRAQMQSHLGRCAECRRALDDLSAIRAALAASQDVSSPPGPPGPSGDEWSAFMARLDARLLAEHALRPGRAHPGVLAGPSRRRVVGALVVAAAIVLITMAVLTVAGNRQRAIPDPAVVEAPFPDGNRLADSGPPDPALASLSGQHFERSKLVVLGLATRDASVDGEGDWTSERNLASSLLSDTRLYRIAVEERGMAGLAGVMRDLELVLLEASMAQEADRAALEQVQRSIGRRDLVTKMNAVYTDGSD